ncbi:NAD(P)H-binding protein [Nocardia sp. CA-128927]|uniref:NAD(P)H-binding protein n=1 Tax=Nocardia sp. CA-128927 TaxID=3239975 RepID=UPI003D95764E
MDVFIIGIIGITGGIGGLLAQKLRSRGDTVRGLVRREDQRAELATRGVDALVGDLAGMTEDELAASFGAADVIVFSAGSNGGSREITKAIDGDDPASRVAARWFGNRQRIPRSRRVPR